MRRTHTQTADLESIILKRVRASHGLSRVELARALRLAPSTAGIYVERLIANGFLAESDKAARDSGRPPMMLNLNPTAGEFVGVDFEARNIMAVAVDFSDKPLRNAHTEISESDSVADVTKKIQDTITKIQPVDSNRLLAIGVGVPGFVNSAKGIALHYEFIRNWKNVPLAETLRRKFDVPVYLENNMRSMALAELWFGQGLGVSDFLCIGIRSGIGAGLVLDGRLYPGAHHVSGEVGRWRCPLPPGKIAGWFADGVDASGNSIALEEVASVRSIQRALSRAIATGEKTILKTTTRAARLEDIVRAVQQRDPVAVAVINEAAKCLGWAIGQILLLVDPKKIIIAGPLTLLGENLLQPIRATATSIASLGDWNRFEIVNSAMGEFSGALGAAALAVNQWKPARETANST